MSNIIPIPRVPVSIRPATMSDYAFIDRLQDMHTKALGFMPKAQLEGKINAGHVLVAEDEARLPIGYVMSQDRYFKRDDVGIVYQLNVSPGKQRSLVGAMLIREVFDRAAYGCKLFCCWCAQDLAANYFWEALGFVPLAFRAGAKGRLARGQQPRAHIFWQKRIREGDATTPYWYPCKTDGGHMREDRIVLPIPPGVKWSDEMPILLPEAQKELPVARGRLSAKQQETPTLMPPTRRGARFGRPSENSLTAGSESEMAAEKKKAAKKAKVNPEHIAKARELRDRYLEQFNAGRILPGGKYEVTRTLDGTRSHRSIEHIQAA